MKALKVIVSQLGAREHYSMALRLAQRGMLVRFITDVLIPKKWYSLIDYIPMKFAGFRRFTGRRCHPLDNWTKMLPMTIAYDFILGNFVYRKNKYWTYLRVGQYFSRATIPYLDINHDAFIGFSGTCLEVLQHEKRQGKLTVIDQIDPALAEHEIVQRERRKYPGLEKDAAIPDAFFERLAAEWDAADMVFVNSAWSKTCLISQGVPETKLKVIPLSYTPPMHIKEKNFSEFKKSGRIKVLWLGTLCLRKGFVYALEAARRLQGKNILFSFYGPAQIKLSEVVWPVNAAYLGQVPRIDSSKVYCDHDIFLIPTLSDGFAITQLEAMAHGLPVIATSRCGEVVEQGISGIIVAPYSTDSIVEAITSIADGKYDLQQLSAGALERARHFNNEHVADLMMAALNKA